MNEREYLKSMRQHIAIVGQFKACETDEDRVVGPIPFQDVSLDFSFYACPTPNTVNKTEIRTMIVKPPRAVSPEDIQKGAKPISISGTKLATILDQKSVSELPEQQVPPKIGGELFVELLNALDQLAPFSHPNFDQFLIEFFVAFYREYTLEKGMRAYAAPAELSMFLATPEIAQRAAALLRGDHGRLEEYKRSLGDAARALFEASEFSHMEEHLGGVLDALQRFQSGLRADAGTSSDTKLVKKASESGRLKDNFRKWALPKFPPPEEGTSADTYLRELFRRFHGNRKTVEEMLSSEPIMAFIMDWFFWKTGAVGDGENAQAAIEKFRDKFYLQAGGSNARDAKTRLHQQRSFEDGLRSGAGLSRHVPETDAAGQAEQTVRTVLVDDIIDTYVKNDSPSRTYDRPNLIDTLGRIYQKVSALLLPGVAEEMKANTKLTVDLRRFFRCSYEPKRGTDLTLETLVEVLRESNIPAIVKWLENTWGNEEFLKEMGIENLSSNELTEKFERSYTELEWQSSANRIQAFIDKVGTKIGKESNRLVGAYKASLVEMNPDGNCTVPQSPPGGRRAKLRGDETREEPGETDSDRGAKETVVQAAPSAASGGGNPLKSASPGKETVVVADNIEADEMEPEDESSVERSDASTSDGPEINPKALFDPSLMEPEELEQVEKRVEATRGDLLTDERLDLLNSPERARQRAQWRALIAGEFLLGLSKERTLLSELDRSVSSHFLLQMIQVIGATKDFEKEGREALKNWQKAGDDDPSGVFDMPLSEIVEIDGGKDGARQLSEFIATWDTAARSLLLLKKDLEEIQEVQEFLNELRKSRNKGWITIINRRINEYSEETTPNMQRTLAAPIGADRELSDNSVPPPGIVWITRSGAEDNGTAELSGPTESLYGHADSPFRRKHASGPTVLRELEMNQKFGSGVLWGVPIFVGENLRVPNPEWQNIPAISVGDLGASGAVATLAGLSLRVGRCKDTMIGDDGVEAFKRVAMMSGSDLSFGAGFSPKMAWSHLLIMADKMLAAQYFSKIVSWGLLIRGNSASATSELNIQRAYNAAEKDITTMYPNILRGRAGEQTLRLRVTHYNADGESNGGETGSQGSLRLRVGTGDDAQDVSLQDCFVH